MSISSAALLHKGDRDLDRRHERRPRTLPHRRRLFSVFFWESTLCDFILRLNFPRVFAFFAQPSITQQIVSENIYCQTAGDFNAWSMIVFLVGFVVYGQWYGVEHFHFFVSCRGWMSSVWNPRFSQPSERHAIPQPVPPSPGSPPTAAGRTSVASISPPTPDGRTRPRAHHPPVAGGDPVACLGDRWLLVTERKKMKGPSHPQPQTKSLILDKFCHNYSYQM